MSSDSCERPTPSTATNPTGTPISPLAQDADEDDPSDSIDDHLALEGIPPLYVISKLHALGKAMVSRTDLVDCTIIIPPQAMRRDLQDKRGPDQDSSLSIGVLKPIESSDKQSPSRQAVMKNALVFRLHRDYLTCQSSALKQVLSSQATSRASSPLVEDDDKTSSDRSTATLHSEDMLRRWRHRPSLLTESTPQHPVVLLPLPDPSSFQILLQYLYHGDLDRIGMALDDEEVRWDGLIANVDALELRQEIKDFVGSWWKENIASQKVVAPNHAAAHLIAVDAPRRSST